MKKSEFTLFWIVGASRHGFAARSEKPNMFRKAAILFAVLAMFSIAGGHWAVLQSVAWAQMLADYSQQSGSLVTGVEQTFDGQHPCNLCERIASAKAQEQAEQQKQSPAPSQSVKAEKKEMSFVLPTDFLRPQSVVGSVCWPTQALAAAFSRAEQPPTPPPRGA